MRTRLAVVVLAVALLGCERVVMEYSKELKEDGIVLDTIYTPGLHGKASGWGYDMTGKGGFSITSSDIKVPEKWAIVFKCQHGKFVIQGTKEKYKKLWERLSKGDLVTIYYREEWRVVYDGEEVLDKNMVDYDFLDARKKSSG